MRGPKDIALTTQLPVLAIFVFLGPPWGMTSGQQNGDPNSPDRSGKNPYDRYDYYNYYNKPPGEHDYKGNDYGQEYPDQPPPSKPPSYNYIQCYSCVYTIRAGYPSGMENCNDPFDRTDIPSVDCKGPCAKMYNQLSENEYMMHRQCMPQCREHRDATSYTQCCTESQCNGAQPTSSSPVHSKATVMLCALVTLLVLMWQR